jgi:hypothetical protein
MCGSFSCVNPDNLRFIEDRWFGKIYYFTPLRELLTSYFFKALWQLLIHYMDIVLDTVLFSRVYLKHMMFRKLSPFPPSRVSKKGDLLLVLLGVVCL